jgi:hypothetical protein
MKSRDSKFIVFYIFTSAIVGLLMFKLIAQSDSLTDAIRLFIYVFISIGYLLLILSSSKLKFSSNMMIGKLCAITIMIVMLFILGMADILFKKEIFNKNVFMLYLIALSAIQTPILLALLCLYGLNDNLNLTNSDNKDGGVE